MRLRLDQASSLVAHRIEEVPRGSRWEGLKRAAESAGFDGYETMAVLGDLTDAILPADATDDQRGCLAVALLTMLLSGYEIGSLERAG